MQDLAQTLRRTSPPEYILWHERRIVSCVAFLRRLVPLRGKRVLDLGHDVHIGALLDAEGADLIGNVAPVELGGHEKATSAAWRLEPFDFEGRFPFPDESIDVVSAMEVIEHVSTSPRELLNEVHRVLKPGGRVFLATPNAAAWAKIARQFDHAPTYDAKPYSQDFGRRHVMCHVYEYTPWELRHVLETQGFEVENLATWDVYAEDPSGWRPVVQRAVLAVTFLLTMQPRRAALVYRHRGHQMAVVARKK